MVKAAKTKKAAQKKAPAAAEPFFRPFSKLVPPHPKKTTKEPAKKAAPRDTAGDRPRSSTTGRAPATSGDEERTVAPRSGEDVADANSFAIYMSGVRALDDRVARIPRTAPRVESTGRAVPVEDPDTEARAQMRSLVTDGIRFETVDDGERIEGRRLDLDPRDLRRLRHGKFAIDGSLDLHGLGIADARVAVEAFVKKRCHDGDRVVVIVHGKGTHSPRGHAALRGEIAAWLSQGRSARHVAAFATAPEDSGGAGALLVLLAR